MNDKGCSLTFGYDREFTKYPSRNEILHWLQEKSGLCQAYVNKIQRVDYGGEIKKIGDVAYTVTFDETANCFIAMKQMRYRTFYGRYGKCEVLVGCPRGVFSSIRLSPATLEFLRQDSIIEALKDYGEIIEMLRSKWPKIADGYQIRNGDIHVRTIIKRKIPRELTIEGIICKVELFSDDIHETPHCDARIEQLWLSCKTGEVVDYTKKFFLQNMVSGCRIIIKCITGVDYAASPKAVYDWLFRESGLSKKYLDSILAFKCISEGLHEILFEEGINCLLAVNEMKNTKIWHSQEIYTEATISWSKGQFRNVIFKSDAAGGKLLTREIVEKIVESFGGVVIRCEIVGATKELKLNADGNTSRIFEVHCNVFLKSTVPRYSRTIQLDRNKIEVLISEAEPEHHDEEVLKNLWIKLND